MNSLLRLSMFAALYAIAARANGATPDAQWSELKSSHFSIYAQSGSGNANVALLRFEELRRFFERNGIIGTQVNFLARAPVRVIAFRSAEDYAAFRLRNTADAYYVGSEGQDYIVLPDLRGNALGLAAHEYTHLVLHASNLRLPLWFSEGLADFFSNIQMSERGTEVGNELAMRTATLHGRAWIPIAELVSLDKHSARLDTRAGTAMFYAQSWALTRLLIAGDSYRQNFPQFLATIAGGTPAQEALAKIYHKSLKMVMEDLAASLDRHKPAPLQFAAVSDQVERSKESEVSPEELKHITADLFLADGKLDRAESLYRELAAGPTDRPDVHAALGTIALQKGDRAGAEREWRAALNDGLPNASFCYRYAVLADEDGFDKGEVRRALESAIALQPDFDDARYRLALLESNLGDYHAAFQNLEAMGKVSRERAFPYWCAKAHILTELERREEADRAAHEAMKHAHGSAELARAEQLSYFARTDVSEALERDKNGNLRLTTTRVPHGTADFNPFVEPEDQIESAKGKLREVHCGDGKLTGFLIDTARGPLTVTVPDPQHVLVRSGPSEFTCGPQKPLDVLVQYAAAKAGTKGPDVLRRLDFR